MKVKTQIEQLSEGLEFVERIKKEDLAVIKDKEIKSWNAEIEDAPYNNPYYGVDLKCAFILMKAIDKGLKTKDAMRMSTQYFGIPVERTRSIIDKYYQDGEAFYKESADIQKRGLGKKLIYTQEKKNV